MLYIYLLSFYFPSFPSSLFPLFSLLFLCLFLLCFFFSLCPSLPMLLPCYLSPLQPSRPSSAGSDLSGSVLLENEPATPSQSALGAPMMPQPSRTTSEAPSSPAPSISSKVRMGGGDNEEIFPIHFIPIHIIIIFLVY